MTAGLSAREAALRTIIDTFGNEQRSAQAALEYRGRRNELDARDRAFASELAYGTIKMRRLLDWYLAPYVGERPKPLPPTIGEILRLGVYQLRCMNGVDPHAAVYETVELAKRHGHRGTVGLVNAVLRRFLADAPPQPEREAFASADDWTATRWSLPTWVVSMLRSEFGEQLETVCEGLALAPQRAVRSNLLKLGAAQALELFVLAGAAAAPSAFVEESLIVREGSIGDDPDGRWSVQGEASAMPVDLLDPQRGQRVYDLCSGRGNKSVQIAGRLQGEGSITSVERDPKKVAVWTAAMERAGAHASLVPGDVLDFRPAYAAHAVLLDAPCSGIGTIGRHAEARWRKSVDDGAAHSAAQAALLRAAAGLTEAGGRLVYAVCSFDPREGRAVVDDFLRESSAWKREPPPVRYAAFERGGDVLVPPGIAGRDGFYISRLRRS